MAERERCNCDASCGENRYHEMGSPGCVDEYCFCVTEYPHRKGALGCDHGTKGARRFAKPSPIHPELEKLLVHRTVTGRMSSTTPNIESIPSRDENLRAAAKRIREAFAPNPFIDEIIRAQVPTNSPSYRFQPTLDDIFPTKRSRDIFDAAVAENDTDGRYFMDDLRTARCPTCGGREGCDHSVAERLREFARIGLRLQRRDELEKERKAKSPAPLEDVLDRLDAELTRYVQKARAEHALGAEKGGTVHAEDIGGRIGTPSECPGFKMPDGIPAKLNHGCGGLPLGMGLGIAGPQVSVDPAPHAAKAPPVGQDIRIGVMNPGDFLRHRLATGDALKDMMVKHPLFKFPPNDAVVKPLPMIPKALAEWSPIEDRIKRWRELEKRYAHTPNDAAAKRLARAADDGVNYEQDRHGSPEIPNPQKTAISKAKTPRILLVVGGMGEVFRLSSVLAEDEFKAVSVMGSISLDEKFKAIIVHVGHVQDKLRKEGALQELTRIRNWLDALSKFTLSGALKDVVYL